MNDKRREDLRGLFILFVNENTPTPTVSNRPDRSWISSYTESRTQHAVFTFYSLNFIHLLTARITYEGYSMVLKRSRVSTVTFLGGYLTRLLARVNKV